jgi:phage-related protein
MIAYPKPARERPLHWVGSAKKDLLIFPEEVIDDFGYALGLVQQAGIPPSAKPPSGIRTARTDVEIVQRRLRAARADSEVRYGKKT